MGWFTQLRNLFRSNRLSDEIQREMDFHIAERVDDLVHIVAIHHELMDAEWALITAMLPRDRLCVWTLNDEALIRTWLERGIGRLTSDSPDLALRLRTEVAVAA